MTVFNPAAHKSLFATGANANERLWSIDMLMKVFAAAGLYNITINNTPATPPVASGDIWVLVDSTDATPAAVKYWNGTVPATTAANWVAMTPTQFAKMISIANVSTSIVAGGGAIHEQTLDADAVYEYLLIGSATRTAGVHEMEVRNADELARMQTIE